VRRFFLSFVFPVVFFSSSLQASQWEEIPLDDPETRSAYIHAISHANAYIEYCLQKKRVKTDKVELDIEININSRSVKKLWIALRNKAHTVDTSENTLDFYALVYKKTRHMIANLKLDYLMELTSVLKLLLQDIRNLEAHIVYKQWTVESAFQTEAIQRLPTYKRRSVESIREDFLCGGFF